MGAESRSKETGEAVPVLVPGIDTGAGPSRENGSGSGAVLLENREESQGCLFDPTSQGGKLRIWGQRDLSKRETESDSKK